MEKSVAVPRRSQFGRKAHDLRKVLPDTEEKFSHFSFTHDTVIYKRVVAKINKKLRLTRRFSLFRLLNKWNKQANEISGRLTDSYLVGGK